MEANAFSSLDIAALQRAELNANEAAVAVTRLAEGLGVSCPSGMKSLPSVRGALFTLLNSHPVSALLTSTVTGAPTAYAELAVALFPGVPSSESALDGLLAASAFAQRESDARIFLSTRAHFLFRGLEGVYACTNPGCSVRTGHNTPTLLGKLYSQPRLRCDCGARVYELLTHRDCGAAYLRGYFRPGSPDFLWHESSTGMATGAQALSEVHLLVEHTRDQVGGSNRVWLHTATGRLDRIQPTPLTDFLELREPAAGSVPIRGRSVVTFDRRCPVCRGRWQQRDRPKIMDLVTKGEDPFAHLVATQIRLQPATGPLSRQTPNAGRKSLLFSDGRQKAARLARDVPRVIEQDAFRQTVLFAAAQLNEIGKEARLNDAFIYSSFIAAVQGKYLHFFDGADATRLRTDEETLTRLYQGSLRAAIDDAWSTQAPVSFRVHMMRALGSRNYSLYALGLGYVQPRKTSEQALKQTLAPLNLSDQELHSLSVLWIQGCLDDMALYPAAPPVTRRAREQAAGYPITQAGTRSGFSSDQQRLFQGINVQALETAFQQILAGPGDAPDRYVLREDNLIVVPAVQSPWYRCVTCTYLAPVAWRGNCAACGAANLLTVPPGGDVYLRARKAFWRDPVERVLAGITPPMTLDVEEHTAQLGFRDSGDLEATTETFERRFRDILIGAETAIDILSCTTTMEVGIDIGSLIAIGMRNMPPSRHNYQQRAGRAGRRGSAVSTVVTYAQNNPHDSHYFENPADLIAGQPKLTGLDIANPTLVERHAFAEILQEFFDNTVVVRATGNVFAALGTTVNFFSGTGDGTLPELRTWLQSDPAARETLDRIGKWLPTESNLTPQTCVNELLQRLAGLRTAALGPLPFGEDKLIEFLFVHGVLPAYAFPRDLIALQIDRHDAQGQIEVVERPQAGAHIALSEYAPGRLVVVNKKTYRVGAVTAATADDTVDKARALFTQPPQYLQCPNCLYTEEPGRSVPNTPCPVCAASPIQLITAIQPQVVWPEHGTEIDELDDDQLTTETTLAQLPVPSSDRAFQSSVGFGPTGTVKHGRRVPLIIVNRGEVSGGLPGGFLVCDRCGYSAPAGQPAPARHDRHYRLPRRGGPRPGRCNGAFQNVFLGYEFRTDVVLLHIPLAAPFIFDLRDRRILPPLRAALMSLASALALAGASALDIDPRELQSGFRLQRTSAGVGIADVYLYDTLAGGAGYSRLIGDDFESVFREAEVRLANCTCDSSCSRCLRTYGNRLTHASLDRHLALTLAKYARTGEVPALLSRDSQRLGLEPFTAMLQLDGWAAAPSATDGSIFSRRGTRFDAVLVPSLYDPGSVPAAWANSLQFSVYEVEKDLPSCLTRVP